MTGLETGPGSLKCVGAWSPARDLTGIVEEALLSHVRAEDIRPLGGAVFIVYGEAQPAEVRDWIAPRLAEGESAFVVEFERWSGSGPAPDRRWLLRRGH